MTTITMTTNSFKKAITLILLILSSWIYANESQVEIQVKKLKASNKNISFLENNSVMFSGDSFQFSLRSNSDAYLYAFFLDSSGMVTLLNLDKSSFKGGESIVLPDKDHWYQLDDVIGTENIVVVESKSIQSVTVMEKIMQQRKWNWFVSKDIKIKIFTINHMQPITNINDSLSFNKENGNANVGQSNLLIHSNIVDYAQKHINNRGPQGSTIQRLIDVANSINTQTRGLKEIHVFKKASPSVVLVVTNNGAGTGSLITKDGLILTNWHVIEGADKVNVAFMPSRGSKISRKDIIKAKVIKFNQQSDLALLKIESIPYGSEPLKFGDIGNIQIGQDVHAIGHPNGGENWTYTKGYISQIISPHDWIYTDLEHKSNIGIQTQTPINPGNSGGPLLDNDSNIIGVNTYKSADYVSANYAVSVDDIKIFMNQSGNRTAENKKTKLKKLSEEYGLNVVSVGSVDYFSDGSKDKAIYIDNDKNGKVEMTIVILEDKSKGMVVIFDDDEDGNWNEIVIDSDNNNKPDTHFYNTDEDDKPNLLGFDDDEDGEVDRYEEY